MMFQVPSCHLMPHTQVPSAHLLDPPLTSAHHLPPPQEASCHLSHPPVPSAHMEPEIQATSPHLFPQAQAASPHLPPPHVTSPFLPHSYLTSPDLTPQPEGTSPHFVAPAQYHTYGQSPDADFDHPNWSQAGPPSDAFFYQNQNMAHLDLHLQNQNQFSAGVAGQRDELENTHRQFYNTHTSLKGGVYNQCDRPGLVQDGWRALGPTLCQLQCSPQGSVSGEVALGRWTSMDFSSSPAEESSNTQFYHNSAPQPFCSPTTPGPSPHYPQTPTISSPHMHPREERPDFHSQTSGQLSSFCPHDSYPVISDPSQHHPHQTSQHIFLSQCQLMQDQTSVRDAARNSDICFSPQVRSQKMSSSAESAGLPVGLSWREECGGGRGGHGQTDWTWNKQPKPKKNPVVPDCRLLCTVCKREFRSLPALNGHMRSHSGARPATWSNKSDDLPILVPPSVLTVMPVTVPVQSGGTAKVCRSGQRRCRRLLQAAKPVVLYRSLLHPDTAVDGHRRVSRGEGVSGVHYTPPPMLCPLRVGPGLYCSLITRRQQRVQTVQLHNTNDHVAMETASPPGTLRTGVYEPRINVGRGFQADLPPLQERKNALSDSHNALLLWTTRDELERPVNQQRVDNLLMMARSSVVPRGGTSPESALHVLTESSGDFLLTVEKLLLTPEASDNHAAQHYKRASWSAAEMRLLVKSLQHQHKDFSRVQRAVQTKSVSECVEFYYLWKKKLNLSTKTPKELTLTLPETNGKRSSKGT